MTYIRTHSMEQTKQHGPCSESRRLCLTAIGLIAFLSCANASTIVVTNVGDTGAGSLRSAIEFANALDTIRFDGSLLANGSDTIKLYSDIDIDIPITIIGRYSTSDTLYISGSNTTRIFDINIQSSLSENAYLDSLYIVNAYALGVSSGGAIRFINSDTLYLRNCIFKNNYAGGNGGVIDCENSKIDIQGCTFINNSTDRRGAALYISSSLYAYVFNSTFALGYAYITGGAIAAHYSELRIDSCGFDSNYAYQGGGALQLLADTSITTIDRSIFVRNRSGAAGGAVSILADSINLIVSKSEFSFNNASSGGGAINCYAEATSTDNILRLNVTVDIEESVFNNNSASQGGGINAFARGFIDGSKVYTSSFVEISHTFLMYNEAKTGIGGGVCSIGDAVFVIGSTAQGGYSRSYVLVDSSCINHNKSYNGGGGICSIANDDMSSPVWKSLVRISASEISYNYTAMVGGGIASEGLYSEVDIVNSKVSHNEAAVSGGGIFSGVDPFASGSLVSTVQIDRSEIKGNRCKFHGGGIYSNATDSGLVSVLNHSRISNNEVYGGKGGGIYSKYTSTSGSSNQGLKRIQVNISHSTVDSNIASEHGGGIWVSNYFSTKPVLQVDHSTVAYNRATTDYGAVYAEGGGGGPRVNILNSTVAWNKSDGDVGGVYLKGQNVATLLAKSSIVAFNQGLNLRKYSEWQGILPINSEGFNVFSDNPYGSTQTDQINATLSQVKIGSKLAYNGGNSLTLLPQLGSVAINTGDSSDLSDAQNGSINGIRDIGSAESSYCSVLTVSDTGCNEYYINDTVYKNSGSYKVILANSSGCDSAVFLNLTIKHIDTSVTVDNWHLVATASGVDYQWLDCNSGLLLGDTNQMLMPNSNGSFAVIVTNAECSDTSQCYLISNVGISNFSLENASVSLFPNPTKGNAVIELSQAVSDVRVKVVNLQGQVVSEQQYTNTRVLPLETPQRVGVYFVNIYSGDLLTVVLRLVKE